MERGTNKPIELFSGYITTMDSSAYMQTFVGIREHNTDYILTKEENFEKAMKVSKNARYEVRELL